MLILYETILRVEFTGCAWYLYKEDIRVPEGKVKAVKKILVILILVHVGLGLAVLANDKVALVLDVGGRGDLCQNDMAIEGATKTCKNLGLELVVIESNTSSSQLTNIRTAARSEEYELIIAVGFLMLDAINIVADEFPAQKFALIDGISHASNVLNLPFDVADATALAGALAGLICAQFDYSEVGLILGLQIPVLFPYESGFRFGVWWARQRFAMDARHVPDVKVRMAEAGGFSDVALGSRLARDMLDQGVCVIYTVAGRVGLGVYAEIDAELREKGYDHGPPFFISGTGCNQDWFNDERGAVIGSVLLRWDEACAYAIKEYASGRFWGGVRSALG